MRFGFRRRLFLVLVAFGTIPVALALAAIAVQVASTGPARSARAPLETVAASGRRALASLDTAALSDSSRAALREHAAQLSTSLTLARRTETLYRYLTGALVALILAVGALLAAAAVNLAGHFSRQLSRPIDELVVWTEHLERREPLPSAPPARGAPEFGVLRSALRRAAAALDRARRQELEAERLRAFREIARRVAHEIKGPLTSMRLAVAQLRRRLGDPVHAPPLEVLDDEAARLERLAREFADFGRLPEGPAAPIHVRDLIADVARAGATPAVAVRVTSGDGDPVVSGHYEPLRRALINLVRNAAEALGGGEVTLSFAPANGATGGVRIAVIDHGPGVPPGVLPHLFEPYFTTKDGGTGLGLALVRQTVEAHGGAVTHEPTPGGGATFVILLPGRPA